MSSISDLNSFNFHVFDNDSILDSNEYHSPQQGSFPMSVASDFPVLPRPVLDSLDLPSTFSGISEHPYTGSSSDLTNSKDIAPKTHDVGVSKALDCFKDIKGNLIVPAVDLIIPDVIGVTMYKKWISLAWSVRENEVKKPKCSSGGRVWIAEVQSLNRTITIRKYKKDAEEYWKVTEIGVINNEMIAPDSKKRRVEDVFPLPSDREVYDFVEPSSSLSSIADMPPLNLKRASENRFTPKYEILAFVRYCISQIKKDQLEYVFIDTVNASNCFRPRFRPYEGEKAEHPRSEYVDYSDSDAIVTEDNRVLDCISWSYRLALQRYHMFFVEFIGDSALQRRLMKCIVDDVPNNLNPLMSIDTEAMKEVKVRTQSFSKEKRQAFIDHAVENMEFHLTVGLMNKDHIVDQEGL